MGNAQSAIIKPFGPNDTVGPYTIVRLLPAGEGGMARVYEALQAGTKQRVALKVALAGKASFLRDEAALMRAFKLHHPHIIRLVSTPIGGGMEELILKDPRTNAWYFAMEYLSGGSLADWMDRRKRLPASTAVEITRQIALALDVSHSAGVVHLDIKPSNILFRQPPDKAHTAEAVLTDFGISRPQVRASSGSAMTSLTVEYASPEQARLVQEHVASEANAPEVASTIQVGPASDVYSLATILYEMLAGHLPFQLQSHDDLVYLHKIVYDPPELPIPGVMPEINTILMRALHKDPAERYPSARALAEDLARLPLKGVAQLPAERKANPVLVGLAGLTAGLALGFLVGQAAAPREVNAANCPPIPPTLTMSAPAAEPAVVATLEPDTPTPALQITATPDQPTVGPTSTRRPTNTPIPTQKYVPPPAGATPKP